MPYHTPLEKLFLKRCLGTTSLCLWVIHSSAVQLKFTAQGIGDTFLGESHLSFVRRVVDFEIAYLSIEQWLIKKN